MTTLVVELDDTALGRLRRWARREGVEPGALAARLLAEVTAEPDPQGPVVRAGRCQDPHPVGARGSGR
jgi:hypothetical protein